MLAEQDRAVVGACFERAGARSNWSLWVSKLPPSDTKKIWRLTPSACRAAIIIATERSCAASGLPAGNTVLIGSFSVYWPPASGPV